MTFLARITLPDSEPKEYCLEALGSLSGRVIRAKKVIEQRTHCQLTFPPNQEKTNKIIF